VHSQVHMCSFDLLGQGCSPHSLDSVKIPTQGRPPYFGLGLVHVLILCVSAVVLHVLWQGDHADQELNSPSTKRNWYRVFPLFISARSP